MTKPELTCIQCGHRYVGGDLAAVCAECGKCPFAPRSKRYSYIAPAITALVLLAVNAALFAIANEDRSWGALGMAFMVGPISNGIVMLAALAGIPASKRLFSPPSVAPQIVTAIAGPVAAWFALICAIAMLPLHGC